MLLSVSELNEYVRKSLAMDSFIQNISIKGEISNLKKYYSGHWYFTLKDPESAISCVMFSQNNRTISVNLEDGMSVELKGSVSLYTKTGQYQFYVNDIQISGLGELFLQYEKLKEKLMKKGMFDESHKKPLPLLPKMIGVITSASGAVIHDILQVAGERNSSIPFCLYPARVQGSGASQEIINGLRFFNRQESVDLIIIARGGGSFEDLFEFNNEELAHEIYHSSKPIISAIGHETDFTICDFVADKRAATPSQAAEIAVIDKTNIIKQLTLIKQTLNTAASNFLQKYTTRLKEINKQLAYISPANKLIALENTLKIKQQQLQSFLQSFLLQYEHKLELIRNRIILSDPKYILQKGYALIEKEKVIVTSAEYLDKNDTLLIHMHDGTRAAIIKDEE